MDGARRYIEVLAFVALWMALGWMFHLKTNSYLLIGVPLVVLFQRFVRQRPLRQLWVRDAAAFRLGLVGSVIAVLLILAPGYDLIFVAVPKKSWIVVLWFLCAVAGAVFAAFAITQQRASAARRALPSFISAVLIGMVIMAASALASHHDIGVPLSKLSLLLKQFLLYFTLTFVLKGVAFRGALDSHIYQFRLTDNGAAAQPGFPQFSCRRYGALASTPTSHWRRGSIRSCDPRADHCPYFDRRAAFFLLESQRHISFASCRACSN
jgi:hypothetical protein